MTFEEVVSYFTVKSKKPNSVQCICPAHDDKKASLSISKGDNGKILLHCFAGCNTKAILEKVGVDWSDIFEEYQQEVIEDQYDYKSVTSGEYVYTRVRKYPKEFYYCIKNADNTVSKGLNRRRKTGAFFSCDTLQGIKAAIEAGQQIFYCEGEKDVKTLKSKGFIGITCGSANDWNKESAIVFKNADVIILVDNDKPGKTCAQNVVRDITGIAKSVRVLIPTPNIEHGDISDYFKDHTVEEFKALLKEAKEVEMVTGDGLPPIVSLADDWNDPVQLPEELISGILRKGHKMLLVGSSKAGKSFLLMELCISIAEGRNWLGFKCKQGRVLYINLEIDSRSARKRFHEIYEALGIPADNVKNIDVWDLRGYAQTLDQLATELINRSKGITYDAVILDPIYKVIIGDENNASDMGKFCNQFDKICTEMGASAIYCHHHSKGLQGSRRAMDRASGSGVFARDPDAQLDMIELVLNDELKEQAKDGATAWRLETSLREFKNITPLDFWFEYPIHRTDSDGVLKNTGSAGSPEAAKMQSGNFSTSETRHKDLEDAFNYCNENGAASVEDIAKHCGVAEKTIRNWVKEFPDEYTVKKSIITQNVPLEEQKRKKGKQGK